jgi:predicted nucleic acid-binding protein
VAILVTGRVLLDTNVFIDYLRSGRYGAWVWGGLRSRLRFLSAVVFLELRLGADTARRIRAVDRIQAAFPDERVVAPTPAIWNRAGILFRGLHGDGSGLRDRLGPMNDLLIALTAWHIGATVVTANIRDFGRIADHLPGLAVVEPGEDVSL